jgi:hypothetical protein
MKDSFERNLSKVVLDRREKENPFKSINSPSSKGEGGI